ncbi:MAG TPA: efflux RND transporter permease subunit [Gammaproteobacteria bacterium]|nr:efflux RND transporter permease subunit [Gammaproteobacteria bacterium]
MNLLAPFVERPVATSLLTAAILLAGAVGFLLLPVAPLPQVDYPTISVQASMPGASPETMASSVATPLERHLGSIADVTEITSSSSVGQSRITLQFDLGRDIDGAARDVQAAINAARADLPTNLKSNPTYRKVNPADQPILLLALTSGTLTQGQLYDAAYTVMQQQLSQVQGIGQVSVSGSSLPAVRVELDPNALFKYGIGLEDVRAALAAANANSPKGTLDQKGQTFQLYSNDQAIHADQYRSLVVAYRNGAAVRVSDIAEVQDSVEDLHNQGLFDGKPSVLVILYREPGANIIGTIARVKALLPQLHASLPQDVDITVASDRSTTILTSLHDIEFTLTVAVVLVCLVVLLFLRDPHAMLIPVVAVPVSLIGTFGIMYLLGFTLDNLSLMALTVATGFVVDDAIVVMENIARHVEAGMPRRQAALLGVREVGFTVFSISVSLVAVFLPILLMGGIVGRFFREFGMTLSAAVLVSLVISLTTTPMMCARLLRREHRPGRMARACTAAFDTALGWYRESLGWALKHPRSIMLILLITLCLNVLLFILVPKGFIPQEDTGRLVGGIQADQSISFQAMRQKLTQLMDIVSRDAAVDTVAGFTGGGQTNGGFMFVSLKPAAQRHGMDIDAVLARLRVETAGMVGARVFFQAASDVRVGGRQGNSTYQYTLQSDDLSALYEWTPKLTTALASVPEVTDVNSDLQTQGLETDLSIDRGTAARLGLTLSAVDNTLYDAFGQREVSTIYNALNQYHVVMEVAPQYLQSPAFLDQLQVSTSGGAIAGTQSTNALATSLGAAGSSSDNAVSNQRINALANTGRGGASTGSAVSTRVETMVPLAAFSHYGPGSAPLSVNHQGLFAADTLSFNLPPGVSLGAALKAIRETEVRIGMPASIRGGSQGTALAFQQSLSSEPWLILAALVTVYIVLGILYESYVHPITILSTLPSAGVGAVLALILFNEQFTIISLIGVVLLIGIVKKNAIMMIDFALDAERRHGLSSFDAIYQACLLRFRPIMMTTLAAMLGALPLAFGSGEGSELRRPLGLSIVGGLLVSQVLTLYTTPVIYLYLDRFSHWCGALWRRHRPSFVNDEPAPESTP